MKKRILIGLFVLGFMIQLVDAAEVCVVAYYPGEEADSKCIEIDEGKNGYELLNELGWSMEWKDYGGTLGHALCKIKDVGYDSSVCWGNEGYWNFNLAQNGKWVYPEKGFDGSPHYETKDGDVIGLAFGPYHTIPKMFKANITKIYVDGDKQSDSKTRGGKIVDVFPGSEIEFELELENLYDSSTDIEIVDISVIGTIEEIDDGDDIEEEISEFDLAADRKIDKKLKFTIPLEVEAKDRLLKIEIDAEDDAGIKYEKEFTYDLEIEKENHRLKILKAELDKDSYKCEENALLFFSIINIGKNNENVNLKITNENLELAIEENFELSNDVYEESSKHEKRFNLWLPENIDNTTYSIKITANYGSEKEIANVDLVVKSCEKKVSGEREEGKGVTGVKAGKISEIGKTETEANESKTVTIKDRAESNLSLVLIAVLCILILLIVGLFVILWSRSK